GIDGPLARRLQVTTVMPRIDGTVLDLVVDYLTFVLVPAELIRRMGMLPEAWGVPAVALILLTACYHYARRDPKTADGYFRGFPALWNFVAFYFFLLRPSPEVGLAIVVALAVLTCTNLPFAHPLRVRHWPRATAIAIAAWAASGAAMLAQDGPPAPALLAVSLASLAWVVGLGLWRALRRTDDQPPEGSVP
ncbi:MAG TPA: phosphatidylcholine/phosphatidylserine synthase, partial [Candidatus Omnitrophota bacterium]|nr:phosphatidylcholine/phosphatidylserine synthase [Candidatus Omnitrophota bacterium]